MLYVVLKPWSSFMDCLMESWNHRQGTFLTVRLPIAKIEPQTTLAIAKEVMIESNVSLGNYLFMMEALDPVLPEAYFR